MRKTVEDRERADVRLDLPAKPCREIVARCRIWSMEPRSWKPILKAVAATLAVAGITVGFFQLLATFGK